MLFINRIIEFFMTVGALPAIIIVGVLEKLLPINIAGTFFAGAVSFLFGALIVFCFFTGLWTLL